MIHYHVCPLLPFSASLPRNRERQLASSPFTGLVSGLPMPTDLPLPELRERATQAEVILSFNVEEHDHIEADAGFAINPVLPGALPRVGRASSPLAAGAIGRGRGPGHFLFPGRVRLRGAAQSA